MDSMLCRCVLSYWLELSSVLVAEKQALLCLVRGSLLKALVEVAIVEVCCRQSLL